MGDVRGLGVPPPGLPPQLGKSQPLGDLLGLQRGQGQTYIGMPLKDTGALMIPEDWPHDAIAELQQRAVEYSEQAAVAANDALIGREQARSEGRSFCIFTPFG